MSQTHDEQPAPEEPLLEKDEAEKDPVIQSPPPDCAEPRLEPSAPPNEEGDEAAEERKVTPPPPPPPEQPILFTSSPTYPRVVMPEAIVEPAPPTIFGRVPERCVTFCVDTSGSMFHTIDVVKEHLMEALSSLAARDDQPMFNLIEFNSEVTQWADKLVQCTPETVAVASQWVKSLTAKTGTNTRDALLTALADPACEAIYLVTDGAPDQYAEEVLDQIIGLCGRRRIHCIYITGETADEAATEFLEDLAVESFGSFHIVTLTTHGCVERITPIYRSDHAHERIIHTVNNTIRPTIKTCSVSTSLQIDPDEVLGLTPLSRSLVYPPLSPVFPPSLLSTLPYRYYYPYYWSRYRPAKAWLKAQDKLDDPLFGLTPAAGSLLVGKKVIARRSEDGYFYRATVQSQNLGDKFLVVFGPCKHGKYRQTEYQDTYVFDIVDYMDALRHTIITGDRVLAPWEPEGERFAPGIVIEGQEKRHAEGPDDHDLTVSFSNGRTEKIPRDVAVWIPSALYERLSLELQMPKEARKTLLSSVDQYPIENLPGYPVSGSLGDPPEYPKVDPFIIESSPYLWDPYLYKYSPYLPAYIGHPPFVLSRREQAGQGKGAANSSASAVDDSTTIIPGTDMTRQELDDRVMSQLMEHRLTTSDSSKVQVEAVKERVSSPSSRLLGRRGKQDENSLKKSVHFDEEKSYREISAREEKYLDDSAFDEYGNPVRVRGKTDSSVNTDSSLLFYSSPGVGVRPRWNYWRSDPSPSFSEISGGIGGGVKASSSPGPFRETALQAPLEARDQREPPYNVEWTSPAFKYVDTFAKHDYSNSVEECLRTPKPPAKRDVGTTVRSYTVASRPIASMTPEEREEARRANRRRRVLKREADWQERLAEEENMKALMQDQHRERILGQMERDRQRQMQEQSDIHRAREAKKKISAELRARIEESQKEEALKEERRIEALRHRRERREQIQAQRDKEIQETIERREQIRIQNNEARLQARTDQLNEEEARDAALSKQHQNAKLNRLRHFHELEKQGQDKKDLRIAVKDQHQAIYRSQIFA